MLLPERFPDLVSFGATGGATFLTNVVATEGGLEQRNQIWSQARGSWEVSHAARLPEQYKPLQAFFRVARGKAMEFRFKDWSDFTVESGEGVFVLISAGVYQMHKRYTVGTETVDRKITLPIEDSVTITGTFSAADYDTGIVTGTPTSWIGEFDVRCRFDTDQMKAEIIDRSQGSGLIIGWSSIPVVEVKT